MTDSQADDAGSSRQRPGYPQKTFSEDATLEEVWRWVKEELDKQPDPQPDKPPTS